MNIYEKLTKIQNALKAPKNAKNEYGNYKYRTIESINEALKPLLDKNKVSLSLKDEVVLIGDRFYIKATAALRDNEQEPPSLFIESVGYAREPNLKKGMDEAQITGTASTYARKSALSGLFLLDDSSNDPDKTAGEPIYCASCKAEITDETLIANTMKKWGKPICLECINKKKAELEKKKAEEKAKTERKPADIPDSELPFPI